MRVLLDTSALLSAVEWKVDLFSELSRVMPGKYDVAAVSGTILELDTVAGKSGRARAAVKVAKLLLRAKKVQIIEDPRPVDDALAGLAGPTVWVLSQDKGLKHRVRAKGVPVLTIRQKSHLVLVGHT